MQSHLSHPEIMPRQMMKEVFELDGVKATMAENIDEGAPSTFSQVTGKVLHVTLCISCIFSYVYPTW